VVELLKPSRRGFFGVLAGAIAAPAVIKAERLMKLVSVPQLVVPEPRPLILGVDLAAGADSTAVLTLTGMEGQLAVGDVFTMAGIEQPYVVTGASNSLLTIEMITREAIKAWKNTNQFLANIDPQYDRVFNPEGIPSYVDRDLEEDWLDLQNSEAS
jgi:hypothetical protein